MEPRSLRRINDYFTENKSEILAPKELLRSQGTFRINHLFYFMDNIYNYYKDKDQLNELDGNFIGFYNSIKDLYNELIKHKGVLDLEKYKNGYENFIANCKFAIHQIIIKHKNIIAETTVKREYEEFCRVYSDLLTDYEKNHTQIREKIKSCLEIIFSYDKPLDEKIKIQKELREILHNIKLEYKEKNGRLKESDKNKKLEDIKAFLKWNGICTASENELEKNIDVYRERYLKYLNIKYFEKDEHISGMIKTTLEKPMVFLRGMHRQKTKMELKEEKESEIKRLKREINQELLGKNDKETINQKRNEKKRLDEEINNLGEVNNNGKERLEGEFLEIIDTFFKNGMDGKTINFITKSNKYETINEIGQYNLVHEGLLSVSTDPNIANKYSIGENEEHKDAKLVIFLITTNANTEVFNPILCDGRAYTYSELDFTYIPGETIAGFFEVEKNEDGSYSYIFHKNPNFRSKNLDKKFIFKDLSGTEKKLEDNKKYTKVDLKSITADSHAERKRFQREYILKIIKITKYLSINDREYEEGGKNILDEILPKLFPSNLFDSIKKFINYIALFDDKSITNMEKINHYNYDSMNRIDFDILYGAIADAKNKKNISFYPIANIYNYFESNNEILKYIDYHENGEIMSLSDVDRDIINSIPRQYRIASSIATNIRFYLKNKIEKNTIFVKKIDNKETRLNYRMQCYLTAIKLGDYYNATKDYVRELGIFANNFKDKNKFIIDNLNVIIESFSKEYLLLDKKREADKEKIYYIVNHILEPFKKNVEYYYEYEKGKIKAIYGKIYSKNNKWKNIKDNDGYNWFCRNNGEKLTERGTKIYLSIDPSEENFLNAQVIFREFMDKYDLRGKMPPENGNGRKALLIYSQITKEQLAELEKNLEKASIFPKLLKGGKTVCDIAIKGSLYSYFKCDNINGYNNDNQVESMNKVRNGEYDEDEDTSIKNYRNIDFSERDLFIVNLRGRKDKYFEYLNIMRNCNAVQRQLLDILFRTELMEEKNTNIWNNKLFKSFNQNFIINRLDLVRAFVENTNNINEVELRKLFDDFVLCDDENFEPLLSTDLIDFVKLIKSNLDNKSEIKDIFDSKYEELGIVKINQNINENRMSMLLDGADNYIESEKLKDMKNEFSVIDIENSVSNV